MGVKVKSKKTEKILKADIKPDRPTHLKFNLSFLTNNRGFSFDGKELNDKIKLDLMNRMYELSGFELIKLISWGKENGIELIGKSSIIKHVEYNPKFDDVEFRKSSSSEKFAVFRLYPNNNPHPSRIIGKLINNVFYIMFIDIKHEMYKG